MLKFYAEVAEIVCKFVAEVLKFSAEVAEVVELLKLLEC